jgi:hypothetical protein
LCLEVLPADVVESPDLASRKGLGMRAVYRWWTAILFAAVLLQIAFAGYGAFYVVDKVNDPPKSITSHGVDHGWNLHQFGWIVILLGILLVPIAFAARVDRTHRRWSMVIGGLVILQFLLAILGWVWAPLGFLHPLNAFVIAGSTGMLAHRVWRNVPVDKPVPAVGVE